ncbi:MAG TPA: HK97-gp10 family putative phage morphogenesis protein [Psychromonas sp.]
MRYKLEIDSSDLKALRRKVRDLRAIDEKGLSGALKAAGAAASNDAKRSAPVDTGNLRGQIGFERSPDGKSVEVFANAPYSGYVEFGTRYQRAQPYFRPAIIKAVRQLNADLTRLINKAIR